MNIRLLSVSLTVLAFAAQSRAGILGSNEDFGLDEEIEVIGNESADSAQIAADSVKDTIAEVKENTAETLDILDEEAQAEVSGAAQTAEDKGSAVKEQLAETADSVKENVAAAAENISETAEKAEEKVKEVLEKTEEPKDVSAAAETAQTENSAEDVSYYIKNLNLSVEQLDMAQHISEDSRLKQEQLLKSIYLLRKQARELEAKSLTDFEAILTPEQDTEFKKLKAAYEAERDADDDLSKIVEEIDSRETKTEN